MKSTRAYMRCALQVVWSVMGPRTSTSSPGVIPDRRPWEKPALISLDSGPDRFENP
jgi:hypothetical protein